MESLDRRTFIRLAGAAGILVAGSSLLGGCSDQADRPLAPNAPMTTSVKQETPSLHRLAADPRTAIVLELFYALDLGHGGRSSKMIGSNNVGDWNYLATDRNAFTQMRKTYASNSSVMSSFYTPMLSDGMYAAPDAYGLQGGVGRGGQCRFFANLILFRCEAYWDNNRRLSSYQTYIDDYNGPRLKTKPIGRVQVGDVIQTRWANGHTAIVVQIMARNAAGDATSVDVIDSNYVSGDGNEVIARHVIGVIPTGQTGNGGVGDLDSYLALNLSYR